MSSMKFHDDGAVDLKASVVYEGSNGRIYVEFDRVERGGVEYRDGWRIVKKDGRVLSHKLHRLPASETRDRPVPTSVLARHEARRLRERALSRGEFRR